MKLLLLVPTFRRDYDSVLASIWIRALQVVDAYKNCKIDTRVNAIFFVPDAVILYRMNNFWSALLLRIYKLMGAKIYWDTCVNYFEDGVGSIEQKKNAIRLARFCDGVICGTESIRNSASRFAKTTFVFEDPLPEYFFERSSRTIDWKNPKFIWCGASGKAHFLSHYRERLDGRLIIISDKDPKLDFRYEYRQWCYNNIKNDLLEGDVAFLPRHVDSRDPYNMGHSSFKALLFCAVGMPVIANEIPSYRELANLYDGIIFLENFDNIDAALDVLRDRKLIIDGIKNRYSCENQASLMIEYLSGSI